MSASQMQQPFSALELGQSIQSLLTKKEYERAAEMIFEAHQLAKQQGNISLACYLLAVYQICLTCHHQHQNMLVSYALYQDSVQRTQVLEQQLSSMLNSVSSGETAVSAQLSTPTLWQRLLQRFDKQETHDPEPVIKTDRESIVETAVSDITPSPPATGPALAIHCMGSFRVFQNDEHIDNWQGLKGIRIFKYLVLQHPKPVPKDILMDQFWPDLTAEAARRNLHQAIYALRQALQSREMSFQHILFENDAYRINPDIDLWIDFIEIQKHVKAGRQLEKSGQFSKAIEEYKIAESIYLGKLLPGELYDAEWAGTLREQLHMLYLDITDQLCIYHIQQKEYTAAITLCHKVLKYDNCHEDAHRRLMICYQAQNQRHMAIRQFKTCLQTLKSELDLPPAPETMQLYQQLRS